jgi:hypothetical protein
VAFGAICGENNFSSAIVCVRNIVSGVFSSPQQEEHKDVDVDTYYNMSYMCHPTTMGCPRVQKFICFRLFANAAAFKALKAVQLPTVLYIMMMIVTN